MRIERINNEIVIRIPSDLDSNKLQKMLNLIRYSELTSKSIATQKQADEMASEVNSEWWSKNKEGVLGALIYIETGL